MSQADNQVKWCLAKAQKEIDEAKKQGLRPKHRGLQAIKPSIELAKKHLAKAEHNLNAIVSFKDSGFSDWSMNAGFYCI